MSQLDTNEREANYRTPRWVKILGVFILVLILLVGIMIVADRRGEHGPGRHAPSNNSDTQPSNIIQEHVPPIEHERP
ncbi:MAG: hypothetical protein L0154_14025 [Chloroflexi bacterium]|nr:hypothetical protein [Chloroflexota bacterium]